MVIGLGFLMNSLFVIFFVTIASFVTKFVFLKKEEDLLEEKYGQTYRDYKNKIKTWV
jgi:protein-S-isoprenylcysteine O-methyltransferase Ste14